MTMQINMTTEEMLRDINKHYAKQLNEWEQKFIEHCNAKCGELGLILTGPEYAKLSEIYDRLDSQ